MTQKKHTPWPWVYKEGLDLDPYWLGSENGTPIGTVHEEPDARLIAAAPELLEAVTAVLADCADILPDHYFELLAAAKAKATDE